MGIHFEAAPIARAARLLGKRKLPIKLVLCGKGDALPKLRADMAGLDSVIIPGWVNAPQIWSLMRSASLGFAPYVDSDNYRKNIPNKIIEYLSAGLPIMTNLTGVARELLQSHDCGYFYTHGSSAELAAGLAVAYDGMEELRRRSENATQLFRSSYSSGLVYDELVHWLEHIALERRRTAQT